MYDSDSVNKLSRYFIKEKLGEGGMGEVYRAYDKYLKRDIALKFIKTDSSKSQERLATEARVMARLDHRGIAKIYDMGWYEQRFFMAMEFVNGKTLSETKKRSISERIKILYDVAIAVDYANKNGVIHRDLKPSNIMIDSDMVVKVMDFGIAKEVENSNSISKTQAVVGTPAYMSPEQAEGKRIDKRSDVYSLGIMLYEIITGSTPFSGTVFNVIFKHIHQEPVPPRKINSEINVSLEAICLKAIRKDKKLRYRNAGNLAEELSRYLKGKPILAKPPGSIQKLIMWSMRNRTLASVIAFSCVLTISLIFFLIIENNLVNKVNTKLEEANIELSKAKRKAEDAKVREKIEKASIELTLAKIHFDNVMLSEAYDKIEKVTQELEHEYAIIQNKKNRRGNFKHQEQEVAIQFLQSNARKMQRIVKNYTPFHFNQIKYPEDSVRVRTEQHSAQYVVLAPRNKNYFEIWNFKTKSYAKRFSLDKYGVIEIAAFSQNKKFLATGNTKGVIFLWDKKFHLIYHKKLSDGSFSHLEFSPDNKNLLIVDRRRIMLFDVVSKRNVFKKEWRGFQDASFSSDGQFLVIASKIESTNSGSLLIDIKSGKITELKNSINEMSRVFATSTAFLPASNYFVIANHSKLSISSFTQIEESIDAHKGSIFDTETTPHGDYIISLGNDGIFKVWNTYNYGKIFQGSYNGDSNSRCFTDSNSIYIFNSGDIEMYSWKKWKTLSINGNKLFTGFNSTIQKLLSDDSSSSLKIDGMFDIAIHSNSDLVPIYAWPQLYIWNTKQNSIEVLSSYSSLTEKKQFRLCGKYLWFAYKTNRNHTLELWDLSKKQKIFEESNLKIKYLDLVNLPNNLHIQEIRKNRRYYKIENGKVNITTEQNQINIIISIVFNQDYSRYAAIENSSIKIYDYPSNILQKEIPLDFSKTFCFTPEYFVIGDSNGTMSIFDHGVNKIHEIKLCSSIEDILFDSKLKEYWIKTAKGFYIYPQTSDFKKLDKHFPLQVLPGQPIKTITVSPNFKKAISLLNSGKIMIFE